jgi:predicted AAA+ superfamily ATPase
MIDHPEYLKKLRGFKDMQLIKIITGVRRCGKSDLYLIGSNSKMQSGEWATLLSGRYTG